MYPINVVEKETNINKYLLRMWERRYSFPKPGRDTKGERVYSSLDIEKLKLVKNLMAEGYRPSKVINSTITELKDLLGSFGPKVTAAGRDSYIVVASPELHERVLETLKAKNHDLKKIMIVSNQEELEHMSF
jgi:MerR family transcriptional regulator, light-induced transcriptional regulator